MNKEKSLSVSDLFGGIKINTLHGKFYCSDKSVTSLKGSPIHITKSFFCNGNLLTSLEGSPETIGGNFQCRRNKLLTLKGSPKFVGIDFFCSKNSKDFSSAEIRSICNVAGDVYF